MIVDANVFLEVFLDQARAEACLSFLRRVEQGAMQAFVTDFTLHSLAILLERHGQGERLPEVFFALSAFKGLTLLQASVVEHGVIAMFANRSRLDFDDAYQAYFALRLGVPVVSFDRHFDGIVRRQEPAEAGS